jgi:AcrR family transcriptional regulator
MPRSEEALRHLRDERREHLLLTAAEVFARKGLAETKIADLAETAGMSPGLLYHYFANKEAVLLALLERSVHTMNRLAQAALQQPGSAWEQLHWLTEHLLLSIRQPASFQVGSYTSALSEEASELLKELGTLQRTVLRQLIVAGQASGQMVQRDPDQLVLLYLCLMHGLALDKRAFGEHFPDADTVLHLLKA